MSLARAFRNPGENPPSTASTAAERTRYTGWADRVHWPGEPGARAGRTASTHQAPMPPLDHAQCKSTNKPTRTLMSVGRPRRPTRGRRVADSGVAMGDRSAGLRAGSGCRGIGASRRPGRRCPGPRARCEPCASPHPLLRNRRPASRGRTARRFDRPGGRVRRLGVLQQALQVARRAISSRVSASWFDHGANFVLLIEAVAVGGLKVLGEDRPPGGRAINPRPDTVEP